MLVFRFPVRTSIPNPFLLIQEEGATLHLGMDVFFNDPGKVEFRRELRKRQTRAEEILWQELRKLKHEGVRIRRQFGIEPFMVDFYCPSKRLAIEVDGEYHNLAEQIEYDKGRTAYLATLNIRVLRFTNEQVEKDLQTCLNEIREVLS